MKATVPLFDRIQWKDPLSSAPLEPVVSARNPSGSPIAGALRLEKTGVGYPIVDGVARLTPELAAIHKPWLDQVDLQPPMEASGVQSGSTVASFGFQWAWNAGMRTEEDLRWRVARRFKLDPEAFSGKVVLDAGAGAGDQSRWLLDQGAEVLSLDLSESIDVVAGKLRLDPRWAGAQADITRLPLQDAQFDIVYCEGVIQHTQDSQRAVNELARCLRSGGLLLATHYTRPRTRRGRWQLAYLQAMRKRLSRMDRYKLLLVTGNLSALAYLPLAGKLVRRTGTAIHYDLQPDFKTTWTNTFDAHGSHAFQRHIEPEEFWGYIEATGRLEFVYRNDSVVAARAVD